RFCEKVGDEFDLELAAADYVCISRWSHGVVLGKCSLVNGIPVQLGQTTGPLRTLRHLPRTDIGHPHRNVAWRNSRNRALGNHSRYYWLASLRATRYPLMAARRPDVCPDSRFFVCNGHGPVVALSRVWSRSRLG